MKTTALFFIFSAFLLGNLQLHAQPQDFWNDVEQLVEHCVVQPYTINSQGVEELTELKSDCNELSATGFTAVLFLNHNYFYAVLSESIYSDDGDLNDIDILDSNGKLIAYRRNVPAFNNIYLALHGGDYEFRKIREFR